MDCIKRILYGTLFVLIVCLFPAWFPLLMLAVMVFWLIAMPPFCILLFLYFYYGDRDVYRPGNDSKEGTG